VDREASEIERSEHEARGKIQAKIQARGDEKEGIAVNSALWLWY
jgi:hypothetical protein